MGQLTQLLLDEDKSQEAIGCSSRPSNARRRRLYDQLGDAYMQFHDLVTPSKLPQRHRFGPDKWPPSRLWRSSLFDNGKYPEALSEYQTLAADGAGRGGQLSALSEIYRQMHQLDKAEQPCCTPRSGSRAASSDLQRGDDLRGRRTLRRAIRVLSDAVTAVKAQTEVAPSRRRTLAILYQLLGQLYAKRRTILAAINTFDEMESWDRKRTGARGR